MEINKDSAKKTKGNFFEMRQIISMLTLISLIITVVSFFYTQQIAALERTIKKYQVQITGYNYNMDALKTSVQVLAELQKEKSSYAYSYEKVTKDYYYKLFDLYFKVAQANKKNTYITLSQWGREKETEKSHREGNFDLLIVFTKDGRLQVFNEVESKSLYKDIEI